LLPEPLPKVENESTFTGPKVDDRQKKKTNYYKINTFIAPLIII